MLVTPAGAHPSSLCRHAQSWDKSNSSMWFGVGFVSDRDISYGHLNKYRHWRYYPSTGDVDVLHADVEKQCGY